MIYRILLSMLFISSLSSCSIFLEKKPSPKIVESAMTEMVGLRLSYPGYKMTVDEAVDYMTHPEKITKDTPCFSLTSFEIDGKKIILYTIGYSGHLISLDLDNSYILDAYKI